MRRSTLAVLLVACSHPAATTSVVSNKPVSPPPAAPVRPAVDTLLAWPVARFTPAQIAEVKACAMDKLGEQRYPKSVDLAGLTAAFAVQSTCDRAVLAQACGARVQDAAPAPACLDALRATLKANPAFAFAGDIPGAYFGKVSFVAAPPPAAHAVVAATFDYKWSGLGTGVAWTLTLKDGKVTVSGTKPKTTDGIAAKLGAMGAALDSFLPIAGPIEAVDCTDNYPDWTGTLTFDNGETIALATNGSNLLGLGGPWQMTIGGVTYLQLGPQLPRALAELIKILELPLGEPEGMSCQGFDLEAAVLK